MDYLSIEGRDNRQVRELLVQIWSTPWRNILPEGAVGVLSKLKSLRPIGSMFVSWWSEPSDYVAQVAYFERRALLGGVQLLIGGCALLMAAIPVIGQFSSRGLHEPRQQLIAGAVVVVTVCWTLVWWFGSWPSRGWSIAFIVWADVAIPVVSALDADPVLGFYGLYLLLVVSVYIQFFDGPKTLLAHTAWSVCWVLYFTWQIATVYQDVNLAVAKTVATIAVLVTTPLVVQFGVWVLRGEADSAMVDALTGLLNRRGLYLRLGSLVNDTETAAYPKGAVQVIVLVIDLDRFKAINDTYGHGVGDEVLVRTARRITSVTRSLALVARTGGEEFVVVEVAPQEYAEAIAARIRDAIAAPVDRVPVTASIGVATIDPQHLPGTKMHTQALLDEAIARADGAMFIAKRSGGNNVSTAPQ